MFNKYSFQSDSNLILELCPRALKLVESLTKVWKAEGIDCHFKYSPPAEAFNRISSQVEAWLKVWGNL